MTSKNKLGTFLKNKRAEAGLTKTVISVALAYATPHFISNWERGVSQIPHKWLTKIANTINVSQDRFFYGR